MTNLMRMFIIEEVTFIRMIKIVIMLAMKMVKVDHLNIIIHLFIYNQSNMGEHSIMKVKKEN